MKKTSILFIFLFALIVSWSCQRDDICPNTVETTPLLILRFYEEENTEEPIPPQNLTVREVGNDTTYVFRYTRDSLAIPLRTNNDVTRYIFTVNDPGDTEPDEDISNVDTLSFSYARDEEYLNRACAFRVNFLGLRAARSGGDDGPWISNVQINQTDVENENQAHVSIFF